MHMFYTEIDYVFLLLRILPFNRHLFHMCSFILFEKTINNTERFQVNSSFFHDSFSLLSSRVMR